MMKDLFRRKSISSVIEGNKNTQLSKTLGMMDLLFIGLGSLIGTGIFVLVGINTSISGPAVIISFAIAGVTCIFVALAYTEVAAALPSSGGPYTYAYVAFGKLVAWLVGWLIIAQLGLCSTTVASGWSGYVLGVLDQFDIHIPLMLTTTPFEGGLIDLPAFLICILLMAVVYRGTHESSMLNIILVVIKLSAILLFLVAASGHFDIKHWGGNIDEFMPFGFKGVTLASGALFLSYTGFDVVANATEESKNPGRDVTIGLIGSILISMVVYILVAGMLVGIVPYGDLNNKEPLAYALRVNGDNISGTLVAICGIIGMTTVILVQMYGLSRVFMAMARDGFMPSCFAKIHKKYATPYIGTLIVGSGMAVLSGLVPIKILGDLASLATLSVLIFVTLSAVRLRTLSPELKRPFRCPGLSIVAPIAIFLCGYLVMNLLSSVGLIFVCYILLGLVVFFLYAGKEKTRSY